MSENLKLWDSVSKTDPKHTKKVSQRGGFTAIDAQWQRMQATRVFGPYGFGWGIKELNYEYVRDGNGAIVELAASGVFFCKHDDDFASFPIASDMVYKPGNDSRKKLLTDMTTKALSFLGFSADVFLGKFDDDKYVQSLNEPSLLDRFKTKLNEAGQNHAEIRKLWDAAPDYMEGPERDEAIEMAKAAFALANKVFVQKAEDAIADAETPQALLEVFGRIEKACETHGLDDVLAHLSKVYEGRRGRMKVDTKA